MVVGGPYSGGQSHQRHPLLRTCTIPLMTRRSSIRSTPRTSLGKYGQDRILRAQMLMSFDPSYKTAVEKTVGGDGCKINEDDLNTSLEFVANQSTNLKITQYSRRVDELFSQAAVSSLSDAERQAARKAVAEYMLMPSLFMSIWPLQTQFACAGTIDATLWAFVKGSAPIYGTDAVLPTPRVGIWSTSFGLVSPQQTFSNQIINGAEQIMKKLVNDWSASQ
jgi:hypothetical protein